MCEQVLPMNGQSHVQWPLHHSTVRRPVSPLSKTISLDGLLGPNRLLASGPDQLSPLTSPRGGLTKVVGDSRCEGRRFSGGSVDGTKLGRCLANSRIDVAEPVSGLAAQNDGHTHSCKGRQSGDSGGDVTEDQPAARGLHRHSARLGTSVVMRPTSLVTDSPFNAYSTTGLTTSCHAGVCPGHGLGWRGRARTSNIRLQRPAFCRLNYPPRSAASSARRR